jgi:AcrR family transcriptional regulator
MAKEIKKETILRAAEKVYSISGLEKTTVTDICEAANISRKTFYQRFKNLEELLEDLVLFMTENAITKVIKPEETSSNYKESLHKFFDVYEEVSKSNSLMKSIYRNRYSRWVDWNEISFADRFDITIRKKLLSLMKQAQAEGEISKDINLRDFASAATSIMGYVFFIYSPSPTDEMTYSKFRETVYNMFIKTLNSTSDNGGK